MATPLAFNPDRGGSHGTISVKFCPEVSGCFLCLGQAYKISEDEADHYSKSVLKGNIIRNIAGNFKVLSRV